MKWSCASSDHPAHRRPAIPQRSTITVPTDIMSKLLQDLPWGRAAWQHTFRRLGHVEAERQDTVQLLVENLRSIESFLRTRHLWKPERYTIGTIPETSDPCRATTRPNESDVTTPPPSASRSGIRAEPSLKTKKSRPTP